MTDRPYTVAVIADVHDNAAALDAVLADLGSVPHDALVVAGDLLAGGPRPAQTLARLRGLGAPTIVGNTDLDLLGRAATPGRERFAPIDAWARAQVGREGLDWLAALPPDHRLTPPGGAAPDDDLLVVHATPTSALDVLILEPAPFDTWPLTPPKEAAAMVGDVRAGLIVRGHIHHASEGEAGGRRLVSVGSVGMPFDGDPRAAYGLAHWDGRGWTVEHRRVTYDHWAVAAELRELFPGDPGADLLARFREEARAVPRG